ncbi:hypothetical protein YH66_12040 [[Brevibacterium] flavum]|uniref:HNH endonuclease n=1 Tax=[Brevibacterium] flavum TaxID=92706 RepID=A0A0F6Z723_9CORY|nr:MULTISPECIES: hypothetical protein [Corynebacterium]AKF28222.1 hypothetical protein YH66_12040 [[Brevibacterium] flavum]AST21471.1 hypothetical protein CEY17_12210 [Corynebacterium glutamicum ATCC 14067]KEI24000.1 hypothetical protein KIQ_016020 [Corynebacterium glutamicum ATCC 14067]
MSKKTKQIPKRVVAQVEARSGGNCEILLTGIGCTMRGEHRHHRKISGREHTIENLLDVCHVCHTYIHAHPALSYASGWLVKMNYEPENVTVIRRSSEVKLFPDGRFEHVGADRGLLDSEEVFG